MKQVQSYVSLITEYLKTDAETIVTLFLVSSLAIGLLTNFQNISFKSNQDMEPRDKSFNTASKKLFYLDNHSITDESYNSQGNSKSKRSSQKKNADDVHSFKSRKRSQTHSDLGKSQQKRKKKLKIPRLLHCAFILLSPILAVSAIPSFYPIYKTYIGPFLPDFLQHFFTDLKNLFLTFFNLCFTGAILDGSYQSNSLSELIGNHNLTQNFPFSMQDWIYSYIRHCDLSYQYSLHSFCLTCTSPVVLYKWLDFHTLNMSIPCDQCITEAPSHSMGVSLFDDSNCIDLVNDVSKIVHAKNNYLNKSFAAVIVDCINTFILYIRFFLHLSSRVLVHFVYNVVNVVQQVIKYYLWVWREIVRTYPIDRTRSFALLFILIVLLVLTSWSLGVIMRIISFLICLFFPNTKEIKNPSEPKEGVSVHSEKKPPPLSSDNIAFNYMEENEHSVLSDRIHAIRRTMSGTNLKPSWITPDVEASYRGNGMSLDEHWAVIVKENPAIAELMVDCTATSDECELLMKLFEQLHTEKEISFSLMESIRAIMSTRPALSATPPATTFNKHPVRHMQSTPLPEIQSPIFSPPPAGENKRLARTASGFGRVVRPPFFRMQKGKSIVNRNSFNEGVPRIDRDELL